MRHLRAKQGRKTLNFFRISFGITPPYAILLDGNFIHACTQHKVDIISRLRKHLGGEKFTLFVPRSVVKELQALGKLVEAALDFVHSNCEVIEECEASSSSKSPTDEIRSLVGSSNSKKYLVATQEEGLRTHLRSMGGVPMFHIQRTVVLLESPSSASRYKHSRDEAMKLTVGGFADNETLKLAQKIRTEERIEKRKLDGANAPIVRKQKAKGPNPLSCMKKKDVQTSSQAAAHEGHVMHKKKRRRRKASGGAENAEGGLA